MTISLNVFRIYLAIITRFCKSLYIFLKLYLFFFTITCFYSTLDCKKYIQQKRPWPHFLSLNFWGALIRQLFDWKDLFEKLCKKKPWCYELHMGNFYNIFSIILQYYSAGSGWNQHINAQCTFFEAGNSFSNLKNAHTFWTVCTYKVFSKRNAFKINHIIN